MVDQEKCTMPSALNVDKNVKFHSNLIKADPSIAENVTLNEDPREEIDIKLSPASIYFGHSIFYILFSFYAVPNTNIQSMKSAHLKQAYKEQVRVCIVV